MTHPRRPLACNFLKTLHGSCASPSRCIRLCATALCSGNPLQVAQRPLLNGRPLDALRAGTSTSCLLLPSCICAQVVVHARTNARKYHSAVPAMPGVMQA